MGPERPSVRVTKPVTETKWQRPKRSWSRLRGAGEDQKALNPRVDIEHIGVHVPTADAPVDDDHAQNTGSVPDEENVCPAVRE